VIVEQALDWERGLHNKSGSNHPASAMSLERNVL
jgi:hypothetical protein